MDKMKKGAMDGARDMIFETRYGHFLPFCIFSLLPVPLDPGKLLLKLSLSKCIRGK